jgi:arylsulfatase A-like enzyme
MIGVTWLLVAEAALCGLQVESSSLPPAARPDIVVIVADDLGWGDVSFLDGLDVATPAIDSIARDGAALLDFHGAACVCTPSRYAMMTGRHPWRSEGGLGGVLMLFDAKHRAHGLRSGETTVAETLRSVGYDTMLAGKWHLGHGSDEAGPNAHGFDVFHGCRGGCVDGFTHRYATEPDWWHDDEPLVEVGESNDLIAAAAAEFIAAHDRETGDPDPFLLVVSLTAPHYGKSCLEDAARDPRSLVTRGAGAARATIEGDPNETCRPVNTIQATEEDLRAVGLDPGAFATDESQSQAVADGGTVPKDVRRAHYRAVVHALDDSVATVLAALESAGRGDALVLFTADHGPDTTASNAGDAGRWSGGKHGLREGGTRVPTALRWRGVVDPDTTITQLGGLIDLHPTLAGVAGAATPAELDGIDLAGIWRGDGNELDRRLRFRQGRTRSVREGRWKWIDDRLYDLDADPRETTDVAAANPDVATRLAEAAATD